VCARAALSGAGPESKFGGGLGGGGGAGDRRARSPGHERGGGGGGGRDDRSHKARQQSTIFGAVSDLLSGGGAGARRPADKGAFQWVEVVRTLSTFSSNDPDLISYQEGDLVRILTKNNTEV
jgi:hypothetical protein